MIAVACVGCGATFKVKEEHAGRRGRCPRCKSVVMIPSATRADHAPPASRPAAQPPARDAPRSPARHEAAVRRGAELAGASPRRGASARSGRPRSEAGPWLIRGLAAGVVLAVLVVLWWRGRGPDTVAYSTRAEAAIMSGDFDLALELFGRIGPEDPLHARAQERMAYVRALAEGDENRLEQRMAENLLGVVDAMRKDYVDKLGPASPQYAPNCRYMLKRAREFVERFPDHPRAAEIAGLASYYRNVASLERAPTSADVRAECWFRLSAGQYREAIATISDYEQIAPADVELASMLRSEVRDTIAHDWQQLLARLEHDGSLALGSENWLRVRNMVGRFLDAVGDLPGAPAEAPELLRRAESALAGEG